MLNVHVEVSETVALSPHQSKLAQAALTRFNIAPEVWDDVLQSLGDTLWAGIKPVALRCTTCGAWHVDVGAAAVHVSRERTCGTCGNTFRCAYPVVSHPLSLL